MKTKPLSQVTYAEIVETERLADWAKKAKQLKKDEKNKKWQEKSVTARGAFYIMLESSLMALCPLSWFRDKGLHIWVKQCTKCGQAFPLRMFTRHVQTKDGLRKWCRNCFNLDYVKASKKRNTFVL